jgi:hypothetical protein
MIGPMKKDDALDLRERLRAVALQTADRLGGPALADDGKLYHDEVDGLARWAQRLSVPGRWPHQAVEAGQAAHPGLRFEVWYVAGKKYEELYLLALCGVDQGLDALQKAIAPTFKQLVDGGKYARRYKPLEPLIGRFYPGVTGVVRRAPLQIAKAEAAVAQLIEDALKPLDLAVTAWDPAGAAAGEFQDAAAAYDPLAALKAKFGK